MELAKRKPNRLENYDYRTAGGYFITICTRDKAHLFWKNVGAIIVKGDTANERNCCQKGRYAYLAKGIL